LVSGHAQHALQAGFFSVVVVSGILAAVPAAQSVD